MNQDQPIPPVAEPASGLADGTSSSLADSTASSLADGPGQGLETSLVHTWPWPDWLALLLLLVIGGLVVFCYLRERGRVSSGLRAVLIAIRISLVALVLLMMYGWMQHRYRTDLPDLVLLLDDSGSMNLEDYYGDAEFRQHWERQLRQQGLSGLNRWNLARALLADDEAPLLEQLARKYNLKVYLVGNTARAVSRQGERPWGDLWQREADQPASRLGQTLRDVLHLQRGRPTAAVVMLTDGVTTEGKSLGEVAEYARRKSVPLYLVGLGSDQAPRDVRISDLLVDEVAFVGDLVNFDFKVSASGYPGREVVVQLKREGQSAVLAERRLTIADDGQPQAVRLAFRPPEEGDYRFVVEALPLEDEANPNNNRETRPVHVRDETIRVLYVQEYPSFEFRFLKNLLGRGLKRAGAGGEKSIELTTVLQEADLEYAEQDEHAQRVFPVSREELFQYDVLIFGDVNPAFLTRSVMENIAAFVTERGGGIVFLAGPRHTPLAYRNTPLETLLPVLLSTASQPPAGALLTAAIRPQLTPLGLSSPQMQVDDTVDKSLQAWQSFPGIYWMLDAADLRPAARVLVEHPMRTGNSGQNLPLVSLQFVGAGKVVFHATDESYRWARTPAGDQFYNRYWVQTLRYLSRSKLLGTDRGAEMTSDRDTYRRGEPVRLRVRFLDERLAPPQDDGVAVVVEQELGRRRQLVLRRDDAGRSVFEGTLSDLPEGRYRAWLATPTVEGQPPSRRFEIVAPPGEQTRLEMDSADLQLAARQSRGKFYTLATAGDLLNDLPPGRQVRIEPLPPSPIWNHWLWPLAFVLLIVTEWLLRKRAGML
ncbi:MAG: hypothetical protein J5I93_12645 [Pirellulaceae bacterium]|nr:hypothetical protein [Pirellulaceae bacterium]